MNVSTPHFLPEHAYIRTKLQRELHLPADRAIHLNPRWVFVFGSVSRWNDLMFCSYRRMVQPGHTPVFWSLKSVVVTCQAILNSFMDDPECTSARNIVKHSFATDSDSHNIKLVTLKVYWVSPSSPMPEAFVWMHLGTQVIPWAGVSAWGLSSDCKSRQATQKLKQIVWLTTFLLFSVLILNTWSILLPF